MSCQKGASPRRDFLRASATGILLLKPETVFGSQANSAVELGIIGCGGRGNWIGNHFVERAGARIVALADPFRDRLEKSRAAFRVDGSRLYAGLTGYRELLASKLDAVAIESPPYFHPEQAAAAVDAGKHVYLAKPAAVDVPGCRGILASGAKAKGSLSFLIDFQTRVRPAFQEVARRIGEGAIGQPAMGHVYYHAPRLNPQSRPGMSPAEARLRDWVFDKVLSGDVIVEQNIHVIDVANWYLNSHPLRASGTGGRKVRLHGDCWDHFIVTYWYPDGVKVDFSSNQFLKGFSDLCIRIYGSSGTADTHYGGYLKITGDNPWTGPQQDPTFNEGAIANVKNFVESIGTANYLNNAETAVESNLTAILGRVAAYPERMVTWDEMMRSEEKLTANLAL